LVDPAASKPEIEERLRSMAAVVNHDPSSPERYLPFEGGGIALVGDPYRGEEAAAATPRAVHPRLLHRAVAPAVR